MLEIGERAGRLELVVHDTLRGHRLDLVEDRRKLLVFGHDERARLLRDMRIAGQHHRDRLADVVHLAEARIGWSWKAGP